MSPSPSLLSHARKHSHLFWVTSIESQVMLYECAPVFYQPLTIVCGLQTCPKAEGCVGELRYSRVEATVFGKNCLIVYGMCVSILLEDIF